MIMMMMMMMMMITRRTITTMMMMVVVVVVVVVIIKSTKTIGADVTDLGFVTSSFLLIQFLGGNSQA